MDEENLRQPRASSRAEPENEQTNPISPRRRISTVDQSQSRPEDRPRSPASQQRSSRVTSLGPRRTSLASRTKGKFNLAGPDETPQLHLSHEPFVSPGYGDLNPSYDQPNNTKPVWSLAKPLPRVVRPGMVPTKEELLQGRVNAQLPAENSQKLGLDVDANQLELGQIDPSVDVRKMSAQVKDARLQREQNFMNKILSGDATSVRPGSRLSRTSSIRMRRPSRFAGDLEPLQEQESQGTDQGIRDGEWDSDEPLRPPIAEPQTPADELDAKPELSGLDETPEDMHPLIQDLVEDEVHNNHTTWAVIRTHHREALAEALAVYVQLTIGFIADLSVTVANAGNPNTTAWAWGLATMIGIYISGGVSGAHLNPAITIMLWFYRGFPSAKMKDYFIAQFLAAFCAALTAYGLYYRSIGVYLSANSDRAIVDSFITNQREPWIGPATAFFTEFLGTTFLVVTVLALGDDQNAPPGAGMNSLIIGLVITCLSITFAYQTGAAFNPSRDFGPRLALFALGYPSDLFLNPYWFYGPWAGAGSGALMGGLLYDLFIFTGGESPVNYPFERTQRALKKKGMRLKQRLHLNSKEPQQAAVP